VLERSKMEKFVRWEVINGQLSWSFDQDKIAAERLFDGCYIVSSVVNLYLPPMAPTKIDSGLSDNGQDASLEAGHREKIEEENISYPLVRCTERKLPLMRSRKFYGSRCMLGFLMIALCILAICSLTG
jgi:hypothetical protein